MMKVRDLVSDVVVFERWCEVLGGGQRGVDDLVRRFGFQGFMVGALPGNKVTT
jgi:hypothetical protein